MSGDSVLAKVHMTSGPTFISGSLGNANKLDFYSSNILNVSKRSFDKSSDQIIDSLVNFVENGYFGNTVGYISFNGG